MKNDLLALVDQTDYIKSFFHVSGGNGMPSVNVIYNTVEFSAWKQEIQFELQGIYDRTKDQFIWNLLVILSQGFNGWKDEQSFNELSGGLLAVKKNIQKYYADESEVIMCDREVLSMQIKSPKIFISHSSEDKDYVNCLVDFLEDIGLTQEQIFCSSVPGYGIPLNEDIYEYLKKQFTNHNLHVILVLSSNYYASVACMNEMGAAWVLQSTYTTLLLPGFEFTEIKGAINPRQIGLKMDSDLTEVKDKLGQLKDTIITEFGLANIPDVRWERKRESFITSISLLATPETTISENAKQLLKAACESTDGTIIKTEDLSGVNLQVGNRNFIVTQTRREVAKWESCLEELIEKDFVQGRGANGEIFVVSTKGYEYIEECI